MCGVLSIYRVYGMYGMCSAFLLLFYTELRENSLRLSFLFLNFLILFLKFPVTFFPWYFFKKLGIKTLWLLVPKEFLSITGFWSKLAQNRWFLIGLFTQDCPWSNIRFIKGSKNVQFQLALDQISKQNMAFIWTNLISFFFLRKGLFSSKRKFPS